MSKPADSGSASQELRDLQRKYKIMEGDKKSYTEEALATIRKQKVTLEKLRGDNEHLRQELSQYSASVSSRERSAVRSQIQKVHDSTDVVMREIEKDKTRMHQIEKQMRATESSFREKHREMGGVYSEVESQGAIEKQIRILENRLDKSLVKFNAALAINRKLREEIDSLRQERVVFDGIYRKLERELQEKKKRMAEVIEVSNIAYEERDQAQSELASLKSSWEKDEVHYEEEFRKLERELENDRRMKEFLKVKERSTKRGDERDGSYIGDMPPSDEGKVRRKIARQQWSQAKEQAVLQQSHEKAQSYEQAFEKITAATGIEDIEELVQNFIQAEDKNFSLFNYVNELNNEIERLEEQIAEIRSEMERHKGQGASTDFQRKKVLKDLEERLARTEAQAAQYETKFNSATRILEELKEGIQVLFDRLGCDADGMSEMLGTSGVTEGNMMQYLGVIEQRTNELIHMYARLIEEGGTGGKDGDMEDASPNSGGVGGRDTDEMDDEVHSPVKGVEKERLLALPGPSAPSGSQSVMIIPPSTGEGFEDSEDEDEFMDDDDERPLTRDELKMRSSKMVTRQERASSTSSKPQR